MISACRRCFTTICAQARRRVRGAGRSGRRAGGRAHAVGVQGLSVDLDPVHELLHLANLRHQHLLLVLRLRLQRQVELVARRRLHLVLVGPAVRAVRHLQPRHAHARLLHSAVPKLGTFAGPSTKSSALRDAPRVRALTAYDR